MSSCFHLLWCKRNLSTPVVVNRIAGINLLNPGCNKNINGNLQPPFQADFPAPLPFLDLQPPKKELPPTSTPGREAAQKRFERFLASRCRLPSNRFVVVSKTVRLTTVERSPIPNHRLDV